MTSIDTQSPKDSDSTDLREPENPGSLSSGPAAALPEQAIGSDASRVSQTGAKLEFSEQTHQYIREFIQSADQKAAFYLAALGAVIAYSNSTGFFDSWLIHLTDWKFQEAVSFLSSTSLLLGILCFLWVVMPRLSGSKKGVIFFKSISEYENYAEFASDYLSKKPPQLLEEKLKHTYDLSKVCANKYSVLGLGLWFGATGTVLLILMLLLGNEPSQ